MMAAVVGNDVHKLEVWESLADASNSMLRQGQGYGAELKLSHAVQKLAHHMEVEASCGRGNLG